MRALLLMALLPLAACQSERTEEPPASEERTAPATPPAQMAAEPQSVAPAPAIALDGEGLRLVSKGGSTMLLTFGMPRHQIEDAVAASLAGQPERTEQPECGAGPMEFTRFGPLQLNFQEGKFVGWATDRAGELSTMDGLGVGSPRAQLENSRVVTPVADSTLGSEFVFGERSQTSIGGFFEGEGGAQRVSMLFAGTNCFFR